MVVSCQIIAQMTKNKRMVRKLTLVTWLALMGRQMRLPLLDKYKKLNAVPRPVKRQSREERIQIATDKTSTICRK